MMDESLINLLKPYPNASVAFQHYIVQVSNGVGSFIDFSTNLSWRMQLGMVIEFLDVCYDVTICMLPNGAGIVKTINGHQHLVDCCVFDEPIHPLTRYYNICDKAFAYITKPF